MIVRKWISRLGCGLDNCGGYCFSSTGAVLVVMIVKVRQKQ